jgi:arylsulfatase A-like enzyme
MRRVLIVLICSLVFVPVVYAGSEPVVPREPNVVLMLFDDADRSDMPLMPHVMRDVANAGATFDRFYATQSLCCPSRASLLTGEYVHNHGVYSDSPKSGGGFDEFFTQGDETAALPAQFASRGYVTGLFGKYLNGYGLGRSFGHVPPGWDRWFGTFEQTYYNWEVNDDHILRRYLFKPADYEDAVVDHNASEWIRRVHRQPFFAYIAVGAPHGPYHAPPGITETFEGAVPPSFRRPDFNERDVSDKPRYVRNLPRFTANDLAGIKERYRRRLQQMLYDDQALGAIVRQLRREHVLDKTYIVVTSDNGWMQGEHRFADKKSVPYEEDVNLPLFIRGPGIEAGRHISQLTSMIDLYPTFLDMFGRRSDRDGRSLLPLLFGQPTAWRKQLLLENFWGREDSVPKFFGIESERYKYIEYDTGEREFYDLKTDPYELRNLVTTAPRALVRSWAAKLRALRVCAGDSCRVADSS